MIIMIWVAFIRMIFRRHEELGWRVGVEGRSQDDRCYIDDDVDDEEDDDIWRFVESKVDGMTEYKIEIK